jgi:hypothetical protein
MSIDYDNQSMWGSGSFFKFEQPGDKITGNLVEVTTKKFEATDTKPEQTVPVFHLEQNDGAIIEVTISYVDLKKQLRDMRPQIGDYVGIKYTRKIDKTMLFDVVKSAGRPAGGPGRTDAQNGFENSALNYTSPQDEAKAKAAATPDEIPF